MQVGDLVRVNLLKPGSYDPEKNEIHEETGSHSHVGLILGPAPGNKWEVAFSHSSWILSESALELVRKSEKS